MRARLTTRTFASLAGNRKPNINGGSDTERGLRQIEVDDHLGIGRTRSTRLTAVSAERITAEERVEEITEAEGIARCTARGRASAVFAEHVVTATAFRIAQRLVRDVDLLEEAFG